MTSTPPSDDDYSGIPSLSNVQNLNPTVHVDIYKELMQKYQDDLYYNMGPPDNYTVPQSITFPAIHNHTIPINTYLPTTNVWTTTITTDNLARYQISPMLHKNDPKVEVRMDDESIESVTRAELVKYIRERKEIQENPLTRKLYERLQVALKLSRSDDNGEAGI